MCTECAGDPEWLEAAGRGTIHTFTVIRQQGIPAFKVELPYVIAMVELDEGPMIFGSMPGIDPDTVSIGMPVEVYFRGRDRRHRRPVLASRFLTLGIKPFPDPPDTLLRIDGRQGRGVMRRWTQVRVGDRVRGGGRRPRWGVADPGRRIHPHECARRSVFRRL